MRKLILILLLASISTIVKSQTYHPIEFGDSRWIYKQTNTFGSTKFCYFSKDTNKFEHNNLKYWRIEKSLSPIYSNTNTGTYIRYDSNSKKIFHFDTTSKQINLIYDFSVNAGDTIFSILNMGILDNALVDSINYQVINGVNRKHIYLHSITTPNLSKLWIDGIGSTYEFFLPTQTLPDPNFNLECHEFNSNINFGNNTSCSNIFTSTEGINKIKRSVSVNYDFSSHNLVILNPQELNLISNIYDLAGKCILSQATNRQKSIFYLDALVDGIYIYTIEFENGGTTNGKIIHYR